MWWPKNSPRLYVVFYVLVAVTFINTIFLLTNFYSGFNQNSGDLTTIEYTQSTEGLVRLGQDMIDLVDRKPKTNLKNLKPATQPPKPVTQPPEPVIPHNNKRNRDSAPEIWLFNNPNILRIHSVTEDLMPDHFNLSADLVPQFERYFDETQLIMEKRVLNIKKLCAVRKERWKSMKRLYYFPNINVGWCPVFKASSTNWKQFFCRIYQPEVYYEHLNNKTAYANDPYCPLDVLGSHKYRANKKKADRKNWIKGVKDAVKFLTVRHPYERLISVYTDKFKDCENPMFIDGRMVKILQIYRNASFLPPDVNRTLLLEAAQLECHKPLNVRVYDKGNPYMNPMGVTFREFIEYVVNRDDQADYHWAAMYRECDLCIMYYDVIEKVETLERDHYFLLQMLGEKHRYQDIANVHYNPSGDSNTRTRDKVVHYLSRLNETLLWQLQSIYKYDFDLFGYKPHFQVISEPEELHIQKKVPEELNTVRKESRIQQILHIQRKVPAVVH